MKLPKRLTSIFCIMTLLISAFPAAAAANAVPLSEFAGETIPVLVIDDTGNTTVSRVVNVAIPKGATKAKENALVRLAALGQDGGMSTFSVNDTMHELSVKYDFSIRNTVDIVGEGDVPSGRTISQVAVDIDLRDFDRIDSVLQLQVVNKQTAKGGSWKRLTTGRDSDAEVVGGDPLIFRIFWYTNNGLPEFSAGQGMYVWAGMEKVGRIANINSLTTYAWY